MRRSERSARNTTPPGTTEHGPTALYGPSRQPTPDRAAFEVFGNSQANITGGLIGGPGFLRDATSIVFISGGNIGTVQGRNDSAITISGGTIGQVLGATNSPVSNISAGSIGNIIGGATSGVSTAEINLYGGVVSGGVTAEKESMVNIFGGDIGGDLLALDAGTVSIFGSDFNLPVGDLIAMSGTLTGFLSDGTPLNVNFGRASTATITLVPEPTTALLVACGLAGIAAAHRRLH